MEENFEGGGEGRPEKHKCCVSVGEGDLEGVKSAPRLGAPGGGRPGRAPGIRHPRHGVNIHHNNCYATSIAYRIDIARYWQMIVKTYRLIRSVSAAIATSGQAERRLQRELSWRIADRRQRSRGLGPRP